MRTFLRGQDLWSILCRRLPNWPVSIECFPIHNETNMKRKYKRTKKLVDRPVQIAVVTRFLFHVGVFMVVGSIITIFIQFLANPFQSGPALMRSFWQHAGPFIVVLLALLPVFVWDTIKLTNRIVGPMVRLRATLRQVNSGQQSTAPLKFRDGDFWCDLADEVNAVVKRAQESTSRTAADGSGEPDHEPETVAV